MARHLFGPTPDTMVWDTAGNAVAGATVTVWSARTGGTKYIDLLTLAGAAISGGNIITSDGTDPDLDIGYFAFQGQDGITDVWADLGNGKRKLIRANNAGGGSGSGTVTSVQGVSPDGGGNVALTASNLTDLTPTARTITAGTGLTGGGALTADRSFAVSFGTTAGTVTQGNDSRLSKTLNDLTDVIITSPAEGQSLFFDSSLNVVNGAPTPPGQDASNITSGRFLIARMPVGMPIVVDYYLTLYGAANSWPSTRPGDASNPVEWRGPTSPGAALLIAGDTWIKTA